MSKVRSRPSPLIPALTWLAGAFLIYEFFFTTSLLQHVGTFGFLMCAVVYFSLIKSLTWLLIPKVVTYYKMPSVPTSEAFNRLKEEVGGQITNLYGFLMLFWMFALPIGTGYVVYTQAKSYQHTQLTTNSTTYKARIKRLEQKSNSYSVFAVFDVVVDGKWIERRLDLHDRKYNVGDSAVVRFSKDDIDIIEWAN